MIKGSPNLLLVGPGRDLGSSHNVIWWDMVIFSSTSRLKIGRPKYGWTGLWLSTCWPRVQPATKIWWSTQILMELFIINTVETRYRTASQSGPSRNTNHLFSVPNISPFTKCIIRFKKQTDPRFGTWTTLFQSQIIKGLEKRTSKKINNSHLYSYIYALIEGPAAAGFTNGTSCSWIH